MRFSVFMAQANDLERASFFNLFLWEKAPFVSEYSDCQQTPNCPFKRLLMIRHCSGYFSFNKECNSFILIYFHTSNVQPKISIFTFYTNRSSISLLEESSLMYLPQVWKCITDPHTNINILWRDHFLSFNVFFFCSKREILYFDPKKTPAWMLSTEPTSKYFA